MKSSSIGALALLFLSMHAPVSDAADWTAYNADDNATNFSPLDSINKSNVATLGLAWSMDLDEKGVLEATPLSVNGVLYFCGIRSTAYAVDARSGKRLWKYDAEVWKHNPAKMRRGVGLCRGVAYADGRVFLGAQDGRLIALNAASGAEIWSAQTLPLEGKLIITGAPRVFNGKVIVGNAPSDALVRGYVTAYDAATGRQLWRFYTVPGNPADGFENKAMEMAAKTWTGEWWKIGGGGTVWNGITFDQELNRIYIGTSNGIPWNPYERSPKGGDNLFTSSIIALDADTGEYIWHYQANPRDSWDYDATAQITLADLTIAGKPHKVLMQAPKNGFFYVIDRVTGKFISAEKIGKVTWAERIDPKTGRPVDTKNNRYENGEVVIWPSNAGAHEWMSMSYSPQTNLVYIPTLQVGARFKLNGDRFAKGSLQVSFMKVDPEDGTGALLAWDPVRQKARWKVPLEREWNGGVTSTAGGLVFQGTPDGYLSAYDASTGALLWRFNVAVGILGAPISYSVDGKQYIAVLAGYNATTGADPNGGYMVDWRLSLQPRRLLSFSLDGTAPLPPTPPSSVTIQALDDPALVIDKADADLGQKLFMKNCVMCHGLIVDPTGVPGADLRMSQIALRRDNLWNVLHEGALMEHGMPRFPEFSEAEVGQIYAYIRTRARETLAESQRPQDR